MDIDNRLALLRRAKNDERKQKVLLSLCQEDIIYWFNTFCWTWDPRKEPSAIPFILYPYQEYYIKAWYDCIDKQQDFLIEKSRDMGLTWMILLIFQYGWLFKPGWTFKVGSRNEKEVDTKGDISSIFEKLRFNLYKLPEWMQPPGFSAKVHDNYMKLINPTNNNSIVGESTNPSFGRGGRYRATMFDEFAFWEYGDAAWASASQSTKCRIAISTPYGKANKFAELSLDKSNDLRVYTP